MTLSRFFVFLTLVLTGPQIGATPHQSADPPQSNKAESPGSPLGVEGENLVITDAPAVPSDYYKKSFYRYTQSLSVRSGVLFDPQADKGERSTAMLGVSYLLPRKTSPQFDLGVDGTTASLGFVNVLIRWTHYERELLRPFYKAGLSWRVISEQRLAGFSSLDNWWVHGSAGLEYLYLDPMSLKIEIDGEVGTDGVIGILAIGLSWGW